MSGTGLGGYAIVVVIKDKNNYAHAYAYLDSVTVKVGAHVKKGQVVGKQGSTGCSTGSHLHYEIRKTCSLSYGWIVDHIKNYFETIEYFTKYISIKSDEKITLHLPSSANTWTVYKLDKLPIKANPANIVGTLKPSKFGGLKYKILDSPMKDVYTNQKTI
ncbi:M23 family metallopeptidase [Bacillus sp. 31A1R]|uniref:M23 family metallopeptidase n=1 Tax=Robertmurraya mangrovi TaxID=3098077 RepID=A0ABU5IZX4_9BACI|nr:M23 family metallopeptidase [Bacillus sp. 31A1R]MDZ5472714.1 M23 family metallopeptidase [Bacillus sp. 31A1R]